MNRKVENKSLRKGLTLIEAMMAVVILAIAAAAVVLPFASGASVQAEGNNRTLAAKLAMDLIERIITVPFDGIVGTFNGYTEATGQITDSSGLVINDPMYSHFSRTASCVYVYVGQEKAVAAYKYILVTVKVYYEGTLTVQLSRLITR